MGVTSMFACSLDDSGRWGKGGLFSALSSRSLQPQTQYELAGQMKDLTLGDAHFIPIDDLMQRDVGSDMVCPSFQVHVCICICSLLPWQPKFQRPTYFLAQVV